jgi:hypothetical protein
MGLYRTRVQVITVPTFLMQELLVKGTNYMIHVTTALIKVLDQQISHVRGHAIVAAPQVNQIIRGAHLTLWLHIPV